MSRKICVVTGSRAEYGLLRWVMQGIRETPGMELQVVATGMHLAPEFGSTYREIETDGFRIDYKVEMLLCSDTAPAVTKSIGLGVIGFAEALQQLQPDLIVLLGDRFEIFSAAVAATVARIPVAHLHGGESTEGAFDESIRHSITKMSQLHFVATAEYRKRVIQLGEHPDRVFMVGGLGIDAIKRLKLLDRTELENALGFRFNAKNLLVTFHPVTLENSTSAQQLREVLAALHALQDTHLIFTMPNADTGSRALVELVEEFVATHPNARCYASLGQLRYLSCIGQVDGVVGNSSSGLTEVPSFRKGTVNIGDRQRGRVKAESVLDCAPDRQAIAAAIDQLYTPGFQTRVAAARNPYGDGGASERVVATIAGVSLGGILKKKFFDLAAP
jgi:GDP/UDP-N,N'-diacetylbacillosamine 2-epimerase (hydrolysing)